MFIFKTNFDYRSFLYNGKIKINNLLILILILYQRNFLIL